MELTLVKLLGDQLEAVLHLNRVVSQQSAGDESSAFIDNRLVV